MNISVFFFLVNFAFFLFLQKKVCFMEVQNASFGLAFDFIKVQQQPAAKKRSARCGRKKHQILCYSRMHAQKNMEKPFWEPAWSVSEYIYLILNNLSHPCEPAFRFEESVTCASPVWLIDLIEKSNTSQRRELLRFHTLDLKARRLCSALYESFACLSIHGEFKEPWIDRIGRWNEGIDWVIRMDIWRYTAWYTV